MSAEITFDQIARTAQPIGLECSFCYHRALLGRRDLKARPGDGRTLRQGGVRCGKCGSHDFAATLLPSRAKATAFLRNH
jgi:hypothetical protein